MPKRIRSPSPSDAGSSKRTQSVLISQQVARSDGNFRSHDPSRASLVPQSSVLVTPAGCGSDTEMRGVEHADTALNFDLSLKGPLITDKLQWKVKLSAQRTPRFLFRAWRSNEDGKVIGTVDSITPRAFLHLECPESMFDVPQRTLASDALNHLRGHSTACLFSGWTHSLHAALGKAKELTAEATIGTFGTHICIIDTKGLPQYITILHTSALGLIDKCIPKVPVVRHNFLAYGVIKGHAYSAVPFERLLGGTLNWLNCSLDELSDVRTEVKLAKQFGEMFGDVFELPVTAMLLAANDYNGDVLTDEKRCDYLVKALKGYDVPLEWMKDVTIMGSSAHTARHKDVIRTRTLLRSLVLQKHGIVAYEQAKNANSLSQLSKLLAAHASVLNDKDDLYEDEISTSEDATSSGDSEDDKPALPPGQMDKKTKGRLLEATRKTPRYLFRCWNNSDSLSGGYKDLNTADAITPLAFNKGEGDASIYHLTRVTLTAMVSGHLNRSLHPPDTQFSSWAASPRGPMCFAKGQNCYISVIDTGMLRERNVILHVPSLSFLSGACIGMNHEYLAHGVVEGEAHRAVPMYQVEKALSAMAGPDEKSDWFDTRKIRTVIRQITAIEIDEARKLGELYGGNFVVPVAIAMLCQKRRSKDYWRSGDIQELHAIVAGLAGYKVPEMLCSDTTILTDITYTTGFLDVEQIVRLLRALVNYHYGRGARQHSRTWAR